MDASGTCTAATVDAGGPGIGPGAHTDEIHMVVGCVGGPPAVVNTAQAVWLGGSQDSGGPAPTATVSLPVYKLSHTINMVPDLWWEWTVGLAGSPPVQSLDAMYGARWWLADAECVFYGHWKVIVDDILIQKQKWDSPALTVEELELIQQHSNMILNGLTKLLKHSRAADPL